MANIDSMKERDIEEYKELSGMKGKCGLDFDVKEGVSSLCISLDNFDDPCYENSKYVLTSPRSLEACSNLGLKPVELLHRPLIDFQEELLPQGFPLRVCYNVYEQQEKERVNKLEMCREERDIILKEEKAKGEAQDEQSDLKTVMFTEIEKGKSEGKKIRAKGDEDVEEVLLGDCPESKSGDAASLQRQRTAWTAGLGHRRVTRTEIQERARDIFEEGQRQRDMLLSGKKKTRPPKPAAMSGKKAARPLSGKSTVKSSTAGKSGAAGKNILAGKKKQERQRKRQEARHQERHASDASSIDSARSSSRGSGWARDVEAAPIASPALRKTLAGARKAGAKVSARDQRILEILLAKREEERAAREASERARNEWEAEKRDKTRRQSLIEERKQRQMQRAQSDAYRYGSPRKGGSKPGSRSGSRESLAESVTDHVPEGTNGETHDASRRASTGRRLSGSRRSLEPSERCCDKDHSGMTHSVWEQKQRELEEKRRREVERKRSVEQRLEQQRQEMEEYQQLLRDRQDRQLRRAQSAKETRDQEAAMRAKFKNQQAAKKHEEKMNRIKRQSTENLSDLKHQMETKQQLAEKKIAQRNGEKRGELEQKLRKSRDTQKKLDEELESWRRDLLTYRQMQEKRAEEVAKKKIEEKKREAHEIREQKEKQQKSNLKKMLKQEDEWRNDVEATIAMKDARSKMMQMEKEELIQESRQLAQNSQKLREELRQHYSMNDLDKLSRQAALEAKIMAKGVSNLHIS